MTRRSKFNIIVEKQIELETLCLEFIEEAASAFGSADKLSKVLAGSRGEDRADGGRKFLSEKLFKYRKFKREGRHRPDILFDLCEQIQRVRQS